MEVAAASGEPVCITPTPKPERTLQCYGATDGATTSRIHGERNCTVTLVQGAALYPLRRSPRPSRAVADVTPGPSDRRALPPPAAGRAAIHLHDLPVRRAPWPWPCCGFGLVVALALLWRWPCCGVGLVVAYFSEGAALSNEGLSAAANEPQHSTTGPPLSPPQRSASSGSAPSPRLSVRPLAGNSRSAQSSGAAPECRCVDGATIR